MSIMNWKLYLESNNELDLVKDILTEIEDSFEISIKYDTGDGYWFCIADLNNVNTNPSQNDELIEFLIKICQKIEEMTDQKCEFKLRFRPIPKANALAGPLGKQNISDDFVVLYDNIDGIYYDYENTRRDKPKRNINDFKFDTGTIWVKDVLPR